MIFWKCKCGYKQYYESGMSPHGCEKCDKCGSTLGTGPNYHLEPKDHKPTSRFNVKGDKVFRFLVCRLCGKRLSEPELVLSESDLPTMNPGLVK